MKNVPENVLDEMDFVRQWNAVAKRNREANLHYLEEQVRQREFNVQERK